MGRTFRWILILGGLSRLIILIALWNIFFRFILIKRVRIAIECDIILMISEHRWPIINRLFMLILMIMCIISGKSRVFTPLFNWNINYWLLRFIIHWLLMKPSILRDHSINGIWGMIKLWHCEMILSDVRLNVLEIQVASFRRLNQKLRWNVRFKLVFTKSLNRGGRLILIILILLFAVNKRLRRILSCWSII